MCVYVYLTYMYRYNYEHPMICKGQTGADQGTACCNTQPTAMIITLEAIITDLSIGDTYNLYEYIFTTLGSINSTSNKDVVLNVPLSNFNAHSALASYKTTFIAVTSIYIHSVVRYSSDIVVFRCVSTEES